MNISTACEQNESAGGDCLANIDEATVHGFGLEWSAYDQTAMPHGEWVQHLEAYFSLMPLKNLGCHAEGFDLGCGSGRWAAGVAPFVKKLHCIDPAKPALDVARRRLGNLNNVEYHLADASNIPLDESSQDFGYSLGVLHHIPDTREAMRAAVRKLKPGAPFLVYLYYAFDQRSMWFKFAWRASDVLRRIICRLPFRAKLVITWAIAAMVYWPLAKFALIADRLGANTDSFPLGSYRNYSFYTMRTDALDRFGTRLEQRFTKKQIAEMINSAGLVSVQFRDGAPYWIAVGCRNSNES